MVFRPPKPDRPDRPRPDRPPPRPEPRPEPVVTTPAASGSLSALSGPVQTPRPGSTLPYGIPWRNVARWEPAFSDASGEFRVDSTLIAAMAVIESDANQYRTGSTTGTRSEVVTRDDGFGDGLSVGMMQVKPRIWSGLVPDADAYTPTGNIRLGAAIMADAIRRHGTWQKALTKVYFPADDPNGTTQAMYVETVRALMAEMRAQVKGSTPAPPPVTPPVEPPVADPLEVIFGKGYQIIFGFAVPSDLPYYEYARSHGSAFDRCGGRCHTGLDVAGTPEQELRSPADGVVTCAGTDNGPGSWGTGCAAFPDTFGKGAGRIEVLLDSGISVIYGHSSRSLLKVGQRVKAGQAVATMGGYNSWHTHLEVREWREDGRCR